MYECGGFSLDRAVTGESTTESSRGAGSRVPASPNGGDAIPLSGDVLLPGIGVCVPCAFLLADPLT